MKHRLLLSAIFLLLIGFAKAETQTHTFTFSEDDFSIKAASSSDSLVIVSLASPALSPNISEPRIPILVRSVAIPREYLISDYTVTISKRLIRENVDLVKATPPFPSFSTPPLLSNPPYFPKIYPDSSCVISSINPVGEAQIVNFFVIPYVFDAANHALYFVDSINVQLSLVNNPDEFVPTHTTQQQYEQIISTVTNPEITSSFRIWAWAIADESYTYLIITNEELKSAFKPLAEWKYRKGLTSKIITTEDIDATYSDETQQMRIKHCIKDAWERHGTMYVLLGGDTDIIPAQYCHMEDYFGVIPYVDSCDIPADIYYSCLNQLNWDTNNDGKAGDFYLDKIDIVPCIDIARLPVQTTTDCQTAVNRIIDYEQNPRINKCLFQAGTELFSDRYGKLTGKMVGDAFFNKVIVGKIIIDRDTLFTDKVTPTFASSFSQKLANGPAYAQLLCHGNEPSWGDEKTTFYNTQNATAFDNPNHTLISTTACLTNAFDYSQPCLSEAFIRNPNSGVIGYLGGSREGWNSTINDPLSYSMAYETDFYERLLNLTTQKPFYYKSFGTLVSTVKRSLCVLADYNPYTNPNPNTKPNDGFYYRWLHYSINAIGDPETPIFTTYPITFSTATAEIDASGTLTVNTGVEDASVCVSSLLYSTKPNITSYYQVGNGKELTFENVPEFCEVWITKQNYIPKHFSFGSLGEPDFPIDSVSEKQKPILIFAVLNSATNQLTVRYSKKSPNSSITVGITPVSGGQAYLFSVNNAILVKENEYETDIDISGVLNGLYVVNLYENGTKADNTYKILKK